MLNTPGFDADAANLRAWLLPAAVRALVCVNPITGCWSWAGKWNSGNGYSKARFEGRAWMVHVLVYTLLEKPVPEGYLLDHLCRNRGCCNPAHLEPVTPLVNTLRGDAILFQKEQP